MASGSCGGTWYRDLPGMAAETLIPSPKPTSSGTFFRITCINWQKRTFTIESNPIQPLTTHRQTTNLRSIQPNRRSIQPNQERGD
jgi:hypothetical protein